MLCVKKKSNIKIQFIAHKDEETFLYSYFIKDIHLVISIYKIGFILIEIKLNIKKPKNLISIKLF